MADALQGDRRRAPDARAWIGEHGWEVALFSAAAGVLCALIFGTLVADSDLWGHVRFGQLILAEGLPEVDPYAYTSSGHPWINHEILSEIVSGWAYTRFGAVGLQLVRYVVIGAVVVLVWREFAITGLGAAGGALGTALVVSGMSAGLATIRPHLFTYLFFLVVLLCLVRVDEPRRRWTGWLVPAVVAVWINFHGGVLAGVGVVGLWWLGEGASWRLGWSDSAPFRRSTLVLGASLLALLVNPYGPELPIFLVDTATEARPFITEWRSVATHPPTLFVWAALTATGLWLAIRAGRGLRLSHGLVLGVLAFLPLLAIRHMPLYALAWGVLLARHVPDVVGRLRRRRRERLEAGTFRLAPEALLVGVGVLAGASGFVVAAERGSFPCIPVDTREAEVTPVPREAVGVLWRSGVRGDLATPFNWGEYVIWHLGPDVQVGMDGRRETVYPDSVYRDFRSFRAGVGDWHAWLAKYGADMALVEAGSPPDNLLALKGGWREVHRSGRSALYGREGWAGTGRIAAVPPEGAADGGARCFPAAP